MVFPRWRIYQYVHAAMPGQLGRQSAIGFRVYFTPQLESCFLNLNFGPFVVNPEAIKASLSQQGCFNKYLNMFSVQGYIHVPLRRKKDMLFLNLISHVVYYLGWNGAWSSLVCRSSLLLSAELLWLAKNRQTSSKECMIEICFCLFFA